MPGKFDINPATGHQYGENPNRGWVQDDNYWGNVVEPQLKGQSNGGGNGSGDFGVDKILQAYKERDAEFKRLAGEYNTKNPFVLDDVLAAKHSQAKEQLDPYYNQTLSDYLTGVTRTRSRSLEDQNRLLGELQTDTQNYTDRSKQNVSLALDKAKEGASQAGLFNSGALQRQEGLLSNTANQSLSDYTAKANQRAGDINRTTDRNLADLQTEESLKTRGINQERTVQEDILGSNLTREAAQKNAFGLQQYLGPTYAGNNNYDILKGLV
jgi:hypothetical protein